MDERSGEMKGTFPEDQIVAQVLEEDETYDVLKTQIMQGAVSRYNQMEQAALTDQRWAANMAQALALSMLGKTAQAYPKAIHDNVVAIDKTFNDDTSSTTSRETLESMTDKMSKTVDAFKTAVDDVQSQLTDVVTTLARIEVEAV